MDPEIKMTASSRTGGKHLRSTSVVRHLHHLAASHWITSVTAVDHPRRSIDNMEPIDFNAHIRANPSRQSPSLRVPVGPSLTFSSRPDTA